MKKTQKREQIHDSHSQGSQKQSFDFTTRNASGNIVRRTTGFVSCLKPDKRRVRNRKYIRLCSLDPDGVLGITKHAWTGNLSFVIKPHGRFLSETLSNEKLGKLLAAIYVMRHPATYDENDISDLSRISGGAICRKPQTSGRSELELATGFYIQEFQERIKKGKTAFKISLKSHHRHKKRKA